MRPTLEFVKNCRSSRIAFFLKSSSKLLDKEGVGSKKFSVCDDVGEGSEWVSWVVEGGASAVSSSEPG